MDSVECWREAENSIALEKGFSVLKTGTILRFAVIIRLGGGRPALTGA